MLFATYAIRLLCCIINVRRNRKGDNTMNGQWAETSMLYNTLAKYDNRIFFFTGHLHMGVFENGYGIKYNENNIIYIIYKCDFLRF